MTSSGSEAVADRYRRLSERFTTTIEAVPAGAWDNASPCEGWTAADVLGHVIASELGLLTKTGRDVAWGPAVADDPAGAWAHARTVVQSALDDPECAGVEYEGLGGSTTVGATFGSFMSVDLVVHRWDIARAARMEELIPAEDMVFVRAFTEHMGDVAQTSGAFGPRLTVPQDADEQTKFLALLGRDAP